MSVLIETSKGDIVIDLFTQRCPNASKNFLLLCKSKYYNGCLFHHIEKDFIAQTGDPTNTGRGGSSIYGILYGEQARFFDDEIVKMKVNRKGLVCMANNGPNTNASQFFITLTDRHLDYLDGKHTIFGEVVEGLETLDAINEVITDEQGRPVQVIRIKHTILLDSPYVDPPGLDVPPSSPAPAEDTWESLLIGEDEEVDIKDAGDTVAEAEMQAKKEAKSRAIVLEMIGDLPDADMKPPEDVLFICKLNPVTTEDALEAIFGRFGVTRADIIRDWKTEESLCYGFIQFSTKEGCEQAYYKMDNILIDDRRIHVDFSQSVAKEWRKFMKKEKTSAEDTPIFRSGGGNRGPRRGGPPSSRGGRNPAPVRGLSNLEMKSGGSRGMAGYSLIPSTPQVSHSNRDRDEPRDRDSRRPMAPPQPSDVRRSGGSERERERERDISRDSRRAKEDDKKSSGSKRRRSKSRSRSRSKSRSRSPSKRRRDKDERRKKSRSRSRSKSPSKDRRKEKESGSKSKRRSESPPRRRSPSPRDTRRRSRSPRDRDSGKRDRR